LRRPNPGRTRAERDLLPWSSREQLTSGGGLVGVGVRRSVLGHDGVELSVSVAGVGSPVLMVHGLGHDHTDFSAVASELVDLGHRVVCLDLRGHGLSTVGTSGFTLANLGLDLCSVVETLNLEGCVIVGSDVGGLSALMLAVDHGQVTREYVRGLVLIGSLSGSPRWLRTMASHHSTRHVVRAAVQGAVAARAAVAGVGADPRALMSLTSILANHDISDQLSTVGVEVRVVWGSRDRLCRSASEELLAALPAAVGIVVDGAGHQLHRSHPAAVVGAVTAVAPSAG
jgi:pimeloyl-ACP methyl ester carboxylesterase